MLLTSTTASITITLTLYFSYYYSILPLVYNVQAYFILVGGYAWGVSCEAPPLQ